MRRFVITLLLLGYHPLLSANQMTLLIYNYTGNNGNVVIGNNAALIGPEVDANGGSVSWTPTITGQQPIGLQTGSSVSLCYNGTSPLQLNSSTYQGDIISIFFGQPQDPTGIACGCFGSACIVT